MAKLVTNDLVTLTNETSTVNTINNNFAAVETALEKTLSRDGTAPNEMEADLDMDSNRILNLPEALSGTEPVRLMDVNDLIDAAVADVATGPQGPPGAPGIGDVTAASNFGTDNRLIRSDGTGKNIQVSGVLCDDNGKVGINTTPNGGTDVNLTVNGIIQAGSSSATNGNILLKARYDDYPAQALITERGTGGLGLTSYMYQDGSTDWKSSFQYGSIGRLACISSSEAFRVLSAPSQNVSLGANLTTQPTDKFTVLSNGNVGIGTSSPTYSLHLAADAAAKPSTNTWTVASDKRLKENITKADLNRCWEIVKEVPLKRYTWKDDAYTNKQVEDRSKLGWIAQDVKPYFKNSVLPFVFQRPPVEDGVEEYKEEETIEVIVSREVTEVEDRDGVQTLVTRTVEETKIESVYEDSFVFDEAGKQVTNEDGSPVVHKVKKMITKTRPRIVQETIEDCLSLNSDQLYAAMYGALQLAMQKIEVLEAKVATLENASNG